VNRTTRLSKGIAATQKPSTLFCACLLGSWLLLAASAIAQKIVTTVPTTGFAPSALAINTVTNRIYILNQSSGTVDVLDGSTNTIVATVPVSPSISHLAVNESTNKIYVVDSFAGSLSVIDGATSVVTATVTFGVRIGVLAINPSTNRIYVTTSRSAVNVITGPTNGTVSVLDGTTNSILADVPIAPFANALAVNAVTNRIYVGGQPQNSTSPSVEVIDGSTNSVIASAWRLEQSCRHSGPGDQQDHKYDLRRVERRSLRAEWRRQQFHQQR
jgi:YVTN family beta-propeller protein